MITPSEVVRAVQGSWQLLRGDRGGMRCFDVSIDGFWRSFGVIVLLLPLFWISGLAEKKRQLVEMNILPENFADGPFWAAQIMGLGLDWIALPLVLAALAGPLGLSRGYVPFIVVRNWTSLLAATPYVLAALFYLVGLISIELMVLASLGTFGLVIWYRYLIARFALGAAISVAIGIVVLDILLSLFVTGLSMHVWGQ